ncbi:MAG TPA: DOMON-like domain-containing protein [Candidatus Binatia bacterium]|nr:DOMON-like domain-containing protein [Candidatus Binatia bacterium]
MPVQPLSPAILQRHPNTPASPVGWIKAFPRIERRLLALTYVVKGDIERLRAPTAKSPRRVPGLWRHTCFEAFIAVKGSRSYYEFNFSPSGEWAAYSFRSYREGSPLENERLQPGITVRRDASTLELSADIHLDHLPAAGKGASLWLGLSAVIEDTEGRLSYWALTHPPGKPDFHYPDSFILHFSRR